jgi:hypothetical protein
LQLRKIGYSGQVIVWNSDEPGCTRIDKPESVDNIGKVLEGIFPVFKNKVIPISSLCIYTQRYKDAITFSSGVPDPYVSIFTIDSTAF